MCVYPGLKTADWFLSFLQLKNVEPPTKLMYMYIALQFMRKILNWSMLCHSQHLFMYRPKLYTLRRILWSMSDLSSLNISFTQLQLSWTVLISALVEYYQPGTFEQCLRYSTWRAYLLDKSLFHKWNSTAMGTSHSGMHNWSTMSAILWDVLLCTFMSGGLVPVVMDFTVWLALTHLK